jgi:hypothetical protein
MFSPVGAVHLIVRGRLIHPAHPCPALTMYPLIIRVALRLFQSVTLHDATSGFSVSVPLLPLHPGIPLSPELQAEHDESTRCARACTAFLNAILQVEHAADLARAMPVCPDRLYEDMSQDCALPLLPDDVVSAGLLSSPNARVRAVTMMCLGSVPGTL